MMLEIHRAMQDSQDLDPFIGGVIKDNVSSFMKTEGGADNFLTLSPEMWFGSKKSNSIRKLF